MARPHRIDYPGAIHHVMNRGADHQVTFRNNADRQLFLTLWKQAVSRFGIAVLAYAILGNHYHVLALSPEGQLSETLQFVSRSYTQQFNHFHQRDGALFRGRFHSVLIDSDVYLARVSRYIELNPVEAGLVSLDRAEQYQWSSLRYFVDRKKAPTWLSLDLVLENFASPEHYLSFVKSDVHDLEIDRFYRTVARPGVVLGKQSFVESIVEKHGEAMPLKAGIPDASIELVEATVLSLTGQCESVLRISKPGASNPARSVVVALAQRLCGATNRELAYRYGFDAPASVTSVIRRCWGAKYLPTQVLLGQALEALGRDEHGAPLGVS